MCHYSSAPSLSPLTQIQVSIYALHLDQCPVSSPFRSVNSRLTTIQVKSHIHPSPQICIACPSRSRLTSIKDRSRYWHFICIQHASQLHPSHNILDLSSIQVPSHPNPGLKLCVSPPSLSHLTFIQIPKFVCHLHPGRILPSSRLLHPGPHICATPPPWWRPISTQPPRMAFPHLAGPISTPSIMSPGVCLTSIQAPVPLSIFRSNSKFDENSECSSFEYTRPITTIFCTRHDSDTVVTCAKYRCDRPRVFYTRVFWIFIEFRIRSKYA